MSDTTAVAVPAKKTVKKAGTVAAKPAKKAVKKTAAKKTVVAAKEKAPKFGKVHRAVLELLGTSKTVLYPKVSGKGELTYSAIASEGGVAINNLTQVCAKESAKGASYPNSLMSLGLITASRYEYTIDDVSKTTPILYKITDKGLAKIKELAVADKEAAKAAK
jgi:hypothetical protein